MIFILWHTVLLRRLCEVTLGVTEPRASSNVVERWPSMALEGSSALPVPEIPDGWDGSAAGVGLLSVNPAEDARLHAMFEELQSSQADFLENEAENVLPVNGTTTRSNSIGESHRTKHLCAYFSKPALVPGLAGCSEADQSSVRLSRRDRRLESRRP